TSVRACGHKIVPKTMNAKISSSTTTPGSISNKGGFGTRDGMGSCPVEGLRSWDPSNPCNQGFPCNRGFSCNQGKTDVKTMMMMMMINKLMHILLALAQFRTLLNSS